MIAVETKPLRQHARRRLPYEGRGEQRDGAVDRLIDSVVIDWMQRPQDRLENLGGFLASERVKHRLEAFDTRLFNGFLVLAEVVVLVLVDASPETHKRRAPLGIQWIVIAQ